MNAPHNFRGAFCSLGIILLAAPWAAKAAGTGAKDTEDSPLYAISMHQAFADMDARGNGMPRSLDGRIAPQAVPGSVIIVEGTRWAYGADPGSAATGLTAGNGGTKGKAAKGPRPLGVTTDVTCTGPTCTDLTCSYTCARSCSAPCGPTYDEGGPTCHDYPTCHVPGPTCIYQTCTGGTTCDGATTCSGVSCTQPGVTCAGGPTCAGGTCQGTCSPLLCPTSLYDVRMPRPGEIQMSFSSSSWLRYTLQCCTNLAVSQWTDVSSSLGNGGVMTLGHTNDAPLACYRLVVRTP